MQRRNFLTLISAALTVPLMPQRMLAAPIAAGTSKGIYHYGLAVFHARMRQSLSAADLTRLMKLQPAQANTMIRQLIADKHIIAGQFPGTYTAANPYLQNPAVAKLARSKAAERHRETARRTEDMMGYLNRLASEYFNVQQPKGALV